MNPAPDPSELYIDDVRFSNSLTTQTEVAGPGSIGHILRDRTFDSTYPYIAVDVWFHYDQVGTVLCSTDASGALISQIQQDTFGNTQSSWSTGQWGGTKSGWHHNTKEYDGDVDLVYMYQRWYLPETGTFLSKAPMPRWAEEAYAFASSAPSQAVDVAGRIPGISVTYEDYESGCDDFAGKIARYGKLKERCEEDCIKSCAARGSEMTHYFMHCIWPKAIEVTRVVGIPVRWSNPNLTGTPTVQCRCHCKDDLPQPPQGCYESFQDKHVLDEYRQGTAPPPGSSYDY